MLLFLFWIHVCAIKSKKKRKRKKKSLCQYSNQPIVGTEILRTSSLQQPVLTLTSFIRWFILPKDSGSLGGLCHCHCGHTNHFCGKTLASIYHHLYSGVSVPDSRNDEAHQMKGKDSFCLIGESRLSLWWSSAVDWFELLQVSFCLEDWNKCIPKPWLYTYLSKWIFQPPIKSQDGVKSN